MKHRVLLGLTLIGFFFTACWQPQLPPARDVKILATVQAVLDASGAATAQLTPNTERNARSALPDNAITFTRKFSSLFEDETSKQRYLNATFEVTNSSGQDFKNLTFYAYNQAANSLGGTAMKKMVNFGLEPINSPAIAQGIKPTHGMKHVGADVIINTDETDFQAFKTEEINAVQSAARGLNTIAANDEVLEYGYVVRSALGGRAIANNGKGYLTIAVKIPKQASKNVDPYKFLMTFVLADDAVTRVTRSVEESTGEVETRAAALNAPEVMLIGTDENTIADRTNIRTSNVKISSAPSYLLEAKLFMSGSNLKTFLNDKNTTITITGQEFTPNTSFFIQSTKLEASNITPTSATLTIPAGFLPSVYGLMAADPNGSRATLYPAFTITQGEPAKEIDPQVFYQSFVDGYVTDEKTKLPIENARVSLNSTTSSLETTTDSSGYYLIRGVPQGRNAFRIEADNYEPVYRIAQVNGISQTVTNKLAELEPKSQYVTNIGPNGGIHYASAAGKDGPFLVIPPGSLERDVPIQFTHLETANTLPELPQDGYYLAFAHLAPTGLVFKKPATLFLPLQTGQVLPVGQKILISYFDAREAKWVQDITSGVISSINGKLFLEYEINHFTWIGGIGSSDKVKGCVVNQNGIPLPGITTNWGVTDDNGDFEGSTTQSDTKKTLKGYAVLPDGTQTNSVSVYYYGSSDVTFPNCIVYKSAEPIVEPLDVQEVQTNEAAPYSSNETITTRTTTRSAPDNVTCTTKLCTTDNVPIFIGKDIKQVSYIIKDVKASRVFFNTLRFFILEGEVTQKVTKETIGNDRLKVTYTPNEPIRPDGFEKPFIIKGKYLAPDGIETEFKRHQSIISIAQLKTPNIAVNVMPDDFVQGATPIIKKVPQGRLWIFRQSDLNADGSVNIEVKLNALNAKGQVITDLNTINDIYFSDPSSFPQNNEVPGHAPFQNGVATITLKVYPLAGTDRSDYITRMLLNKAAPFSSYSPANTPINPMLRVSTRASTADDIQVLPESYSMIYSSKVAEKSPSIGAKSVGFWGQVKSFFTWENISSAAGQVAQFGLGFVPVLGGAIDCAKGAYALIANSDVDLVETELGCVGMSIDAIMTAAAIADGCTTCPGYLANKAIMIALKRINQISKAVEGWMTKALLGLLERIRERGVFYAKEFIERIGNLKFLKEMDDAGEKVLLEKSDNIVGDLVKACTIGVRSGVRSNETRANPDECLPDEALDIFAKAGQKVKLDNVISEQEFVDLTSEVSGIPGLRRVDPTNELGGGPLNKLATGKLDESGASGAVEEMKYAAKHKTDLEAEMSKPIATSRGNTEIDLVWRDSEGKLYYDDVKSSLKSGSPNTSATEQARKLCLAARGGSAIGRWVIASIPSVLTPEMGKWIYGLEKAGIKVVDTSGNRIVGDQSLSDSDLAQKALDCR